MKIEKAIEIQDRAQKQGGTFGFVREFEESAQLSIEALREKQKRDKGCKFCENVPSKYKGITVETFEQTAADDEHVVGIDVKYCPNCGRKLGENDE